MISTLLRENYFINLLRLPTCSTFSGQLWHTLRDESEKLFAPRTRAAEIISSHTAFVICSTERYRVITRPPNVVSRLAMRLVACPIHNVDRNPRNLESAQNTRRSRLRFRSYALSVRMVPHHNADKVQIASPCSGVRHNRYTSYQQNTAP